MPTFRPAEPVPNITKSYREMALEICKRLGNTPCGYVWAGSVPDGIAAATDSFSPRSTTYPISAQADMLRRLAVVANKMADRLVVE